MSIASDAMKAATDDARLVLGEALQRRWDHPFRFYRYHLRMSALYASLPGLYAKAKAWWHRQRRRHFYSMALATNEGLTCALAMSLEGGGG